MPTEIKIMNGRLVGGHPMKRSPVMDKKTVPPTRVMQADGVTPATEMYMGVAVPKTPGVDWKQEEWGQSIVAEAQAGWLNGEHNAPAFAWKITDGDSTIPNQNGKIPNQREGYPGHWVLNLSTRMGVKAFHIHKYDPMDQIQNPEEIKPGDYCMVLIGVKANNPSQSPGVYLNPTNFVLARPGDQIILEGGTTAAEAFGGAATPPAGPAQQPVINQLPPQPGAAPAPAQQPITPNPAFLNGPGAPAPVNTPPVPTTPPAPVEQSYNCNGVVYTHSQLVAAKWTPEQIAATPLA